MFAQTTAHVLTVFHFSSLGSFAFSTLCMLCSGSRSSMLLLFLGVLLKDHGKVLTVYHFNIIKKKNCMEDCWAKMKSLPYWIAFRQNHHILFHCLHLIKEPPCPYWSAFPKLEIIFWVEHMNGWTLRFSLLLNFNETSWMLLWLQHQPNSTLYLSFRKFLWSHQAPDLYQIMLIHTTKIDLTGGKLFWEICWLMDHHLSMESLNHLNNIRI